MFKILFKTKKNTIWDIRELKTPWGGNDMFKKIMGRGSMI